MDKTKALYLPHDMAYPPVHVLDREALSEADAETLPNVCPPGAIDLDMTEEEIEVEVGAVIVATGWRPYDATKLDNLGFGRVPERDHQRHDGATGRRRRTHRRGDRPAVRRQEGGERGLRAVRRIEG